MSTQLHSVAEAARRLSCGRTHVYDLIAAGRLKAVNIGLGRVQTRISEAELERFLGRNQVGRAS